MLVRVRQHLQLPVRHAHRGPGARRRGRRRMAPLPARPDLPRTRLEHLAFRAAGSERPLYVARHGTPVCAPRPAMVQALGLSPPRLAADEGGVPGGARARMGAFCRRVMLQNWVEDREIDDAQAVLDALDGLVPDAQALLDAAQAPEAKLRLRERTEAAAARGIFGAPTFFTGDEMFWGNDRLEEAIACAGAGHGLP
ncbi:hypothetical protein G4G28_10400 [Massilia sp. Dwa41.01b]|nr:hypothetical protein G4G28_10400 [Massilia sp. Dwa41.01b]